MTELLSALNQKFAGKKTYATAIVAVLSAAITYFLGDVTLFQALQVALPAVLAACVRHGMTTEAVTTEAVVVAVAEEEKAKK